MPKLPDASQLGYSTPKSANRAAINYSPALAPQSYAGANIQAPKPQQSPLSAAAESLQPAVETLNEQAKLVRTREDTINRLRDHDKFYQDVFDEFNAAQTELDLTDPRVAKEWNQKIRDKATQAIANHQGSEESRINLLEKINDVSDKFTQQMTLNSLSAQRKYLMTKAGEYTTDFARQARENPENMGAIFKQADAVLSEFSPAMYPEDEIDWINTVHDQIAVSAINSYTDAGQYEKARDLINENPFILQSMHPDSQKAVLKTIQGGIDARDKALNDMRDKMSAIKGAAAELGIEVDPGKMFSAVTGITEAQTPQDKIDQFAGIVGKNADELPQSVIAKIGFGVDLPAEADIDYNKEFTPSGKLTPKGIQGRISKPFEKAAYAQLLKTKVDGAVDLFRTDGNSQALLSAMTTFLKALDEGAIVREGDITLQRSAQSLGDNLRAWKEQMESGQIVSNTLVDQMQSTMTDFTTKALESAKVQIDPYMEEANSQGYRWLDIGIPKESYDAVFKDVQGKPLGSGGDTKNPLNIRNNNPGNIRPKGDKQGFLKFETPEEGMLAMKEDLAAKVNGKSAAMKARFGGTYEPTLSNIITTWAPPEENNTEEYIKTVSQKTGFSPEDIILPENIDTLMEAMIEVEGGAKAAEYFKAAQPKRKRVRITLTGD